MGTTARVVEYSIALWLAMNNVIELFLQRLVGMAAWAAVPDWVGPTAFDLYVPVLAANIIVLRYPSVSRRRFWVICLTTKVVSGFFIILLSIAFHGAHGDLPAPEPVESNYLSGNVEHGGGAFVRARDQRRLSTGIPAVRSRVPSVNRSVGLTVCLSESPC